MKGKRRRDRQKKRREDNIKEWTGMDFARLQLGQLHEDKTMWKGIFAKTSVVPRRPSSAMGYNRKEWNYPLVQAGKQKKKGERHDLTTLKCPFHWTALLVLFKILIKML